MSQMLTLYITPVIFLYMDRITHRRARRPADAGLLTEPAPLAK